MRHVSLPCLLFAVALGCLDRAAEAQCPPVWWSGGPQPHLSGRATASTLWDPDGAGPAPQRLVVVGENLTAGNVAGHFAVTWDDSQWQGLGTGLPGGARATTVWNGQLVVGGAISFGGSDTVAQWSGSEWLPLAGLFHTVGNLATWNGNLFASGFPGTSVPAPLWQWNGTAWSTLPAPPSLRSIRAMVSFGGHLCVAGDTFSGQGVLERWNGTSWSPSILASRVITSLSVRAFSLSTTLYAAGEFTSIGGSSARYIARTSGFTVWTEVDGGLPGPCHSMHVRATGAVGTAIVASSSTGQVSQNTAGTWVSMGQSILESIQYYGGVYYGTIDSLPGQTACVRYVGTLWGQVRVAGIDGDVYAATPSGDDVIVGGAFTATVSGPMNRIARWNGTTFQSLGTGIGGTSVNALLTLDNGDIVAGGLFDRAGSVAANNIARWNGSAWSPLGIGTDGAVLALCEMPNGDIVAGGSFDNAGGIGAIRVAVWNGRDWRPVGTAIGGFDNSVLALAVRSDGMLFAGGSFTAFGPVVGVNHIAQWNGINWTLPRGGCNGTVSGLAVLPNDDVVAVGGFTTAGGVPTAGCARWNGSTWLAMGTPGGAPVRAALVLPNGELLAGHEQSVDRTAVSRWNGSTWSEVGVLGGNPDVRTLVQRRDGSVIVGGTFSVVDGIVSRNLAILASSCMPLVRPYGAGCSSANGPLVIAADTLPWLGSTFRTTTSGVAAGSVAVGVIGLSQVAIPLSTLIGQGQPGCSLLTSIDITLALASGSGTARSAIPLPDDASLIGGRFNQQTIPLEVDGNGALLAVRASNAVAATIGAL